MSFDRPWVLLLLVIPLLVAGSVRGVTGKPGAYAARLPSRRPARWLRALTMACVIVALAEPTLPLGARGLAVAVVVDRSASMEPALGPVTAAVAAFLQDPPQRAAGGGPVQVALISAGGAAEVERSPAPLPQPPFPAWTTPAHREATDLAAALRVAAALLPSDHWRRVVVISDGRATQGDVVTEARALAAAGITVDTVHVDPLPGPDVAVIGVRPPATAQPGRPVAVEITVRATHPVQARLHLMADGTAVASRTVDLAAGDSRFVLTATPSRPGPWPLQAVVEALDPASDGEAANNAFDAVIQVEGPRPVLVLSQDEGSLLARALAAQGLAVEHRTLAQRPADLAGWARYGAVILDNVPAPALGEGAMADLERFVRDLGGGLALAGMPDTFGPGGYAGTPVERALPVHTDVRARKNLPTVALTLVIDRSGSMEGTKLAMAVEAARRVAQLLTSFDRLGVVLFDQQASVTRNLEPVTDPDQVLAAFPAQAGGGTSLGAGLAAALNLMKGVEADVRHVIALTDGVSEPFDVTGTAEAFRDAGITLSTVAIGPDADLGVLDQLARHGGGAMYVARDPGQLPSLLVRDAVLKARPLVVDEPFLPTVTALGAAGGPGALLAGLGPAGSGARGSAPPGNGGGRGPGDITLPPLGGYVLTSPKDRAEVLLTGPDGDPVLAAWYYGLGRAVAWTGPTAGPGVAAWLEEPRPYARLWANVADWLAGEGTGPGGGSGPAGAGPAATAGSGGREGLERPQGGGGAHEEGRGATPWRVEARPTGSGLVAVTVYGSPPPAGRVRIGEAAAPLRPVGAGQSQAMVPVAKAGVHPVVVEAEPDRVLTTTVAVPYPAELLPGAPDGSGRAVLEAVAAVTGGRFWAWEDFDLPAALDPSGLPAPPGRRPLWPFLLLLAALLLPADVAARRLGWDGRLRLRGLIPAAVRRLSPLRRMAAVWRLSPVRRRVAARPGPSRKAWTGTPEAPQGSPTGPWEPTLPGGPATPSPLREPERRPAREPGPVGGVFVPEGSSAAAGSGPSSPTKPGPAQDSPGTVAAGAAGPGVQSSGGPPGEAPSGGAMPGSVPPGPGAPAGNGPSSAGSPPTSVDPALARLQAARLRSRHRAAERVRRHIDPSQ
ncbi:VWA domain-containing protein [Thermaerobacter litoralis]